jgi:hypothetical protein
MDNPPPFDHTTSLPKDWIFQVNKWAARHEWRKWYSPLAAYIRQRGNTSIHVDVIQDMARAATSSEAYPVTRWNVEYFLRRIRDRLDSEWPIQKVLEDFKPEQGGLHAIELGVRLHGAIGELMALDAWMDDDWIPIQREDKAGPDWHLRQGGREVAIEVKRRQHPGHLSAYLDWAVKGQKMLPGYEWMNAYTWCWRLQAAESAHAAEHLDWLVHGLPEVEAYCANSAHYEMGRFTSIAGAKLEMKHWGVQGGLILRRTVTGGSCQVELTPRTDPTYFSSGSDRFYSSRTELGENEAAIFRERVIEPTLGAAARQLSGRTICMILWSIPEDWEKALSEDWIQKQLNGHEVPLGIWPVGYIEWGARKLVLNRAARELLVS